MKFRFRGGRDCPDWLLGEINSMSGFSPEEIRSMSEELLELQLNDGIPREEGWKRLTALIERDKSEEAMKAVSAALTFILVSSAKFQVHGPILLTELQQLGLPKEHSQCILEVFEKRGAEIRDRLAGSESSLLLLHPRGLSAISCTVKDQEVHLRGLDPAHPHISLTPNAFASLLKDLREAERRLRSPLSAPCT